MKVKIKRFDKSLPLPVHKTAGAAAIDLYSRIDVDIQPNEIAYIPMNTAIKIPSGYFTLLAGRSSTHKLGLQSINGIGVIDSDYCGDNDEISFAAHNFTNSPVHVEKGTRLCQLILIKYENFDLEEVDKMDAPDRGGYGSTGNK